MNILIKTEKFKNCLNIHPRHDIAKRIEIYLHFYIESNIWDPLFNIIYDQALIKIEENICESFEKQ